MAAKINKPGEPDPDFESPPTSRGLSLTIRSKKSKYGWGLAVFYLILFLAAALPTARALGFEDELKRLKLDLPQAQVEKAVLFEQWRAALAIALGVVFIALGVMLKELPAAHHRTLPASCFSDYSKCAHGAKPLRRDWRVGQVFIAISLGTACYAAFICQRNAALVRVGFLN